jgi:hypothetical protein
MILGLDVSTSTIGYCIIDENRKVHRIGYVTLTGFDNLLQKALFTFNFFCIIFKQYKITKICIEDISKKFSPGFSSAQIITTLAKFNGMINFVCYYLTGIEPLLITSTAARKLAFNKKFDRETDIKLQMFNEFSFRNKNFIWPQNKNKKTVKEVFDATDAYVMAMACHTTINAK